MWLELWNRALRFFRWPSRHRGRTGQVRVMLLTRVGCHLCDDALGVLRKLHSEFEFEMDEIDIDTDQHGQLRSQYGDLVPVIILDGRARLWGRINPVLLRRLLLKECR